MFIDRSSIKELQDSFVPIVNSIFGIPGGIGWGFRTITRQAAQHEFDVLYKFFTPLGPMFRLCYRLLNDSNSIKFEIPIELLPVSAQTHTIHKPLFPIIVSAEKDHTHVAQSTFFPILCGQNQYRAQSPRNCFAIAECIRLLYTALCAARYGAAAQNVSGCARRSQRELEYRLLLSDGRLFVFVFARQSGFGCVAEQYLQFDESHNNDANSADSVCE